MFGKIRPRRRGVQRIRMSMSATSALEAGVHFFFFNELAPVGLCNALADGGAKAASSCSGREAASFTNRPASVSAWAAIWESCVSCSGVKCTSMPSTVRENWKRGNTGMKAPEVRPRADLAVARQGSGSIDENMRLIIGAGSLLRVAAAAGQVSAQRLGRWGRFAGW
jgi:hypothetical protein